MKLEDLERDILGAYLNYENNDLKTAVKQLDMSANSLLKDDKTLDPVWTDISKNVYISVILSNFSKGNEFSLKDLQSMLNNQALVYNNIIEFCNKFENTEEITFATRLKKISKNPLKSAIQILKENIERLTNIKENNNPPNTIKCFCGNELQVDWSKFPNTEKIVYLKCPNCNSELKRGNPLYNTEKQITKKSKGTFVNIKDLEQLKIYHNDVLDKNQIIPKQLATNWILKKNFYNFEITSEKIIKEYGNNHDEDFYDEEKIITEDFYDINAPRISIRFFCKKKDKDFVLIPYSDVININDIYYSIPAIEVYGIDIEEIGLNSLN